jgi:hypothetical protein
MNSLKLGDKAPDFTAPTTQGKLIFMNGWGMHGEFYFPIRLILPLFAPRNWEACQSLNWNLMSVT